MLVRDLVVSVCSWMDACTEDLAGASAFTAALVQEARAEAAEAVQAKEAASRAAVEARAQVPAGALHRQGVCLRTSSRMRGLTDRSGALEYALP
jgi:hypothetical protein